MRSRLAYVALVVLVMSAALAGSAIAVNPGPTQLPLVPELRATVHDLCTGRAVPGIVASVSDVTGARDTPSKTTTGGFVFQNITPPNPSVTLHLSAPGYQPLGDPAAADPGVPIERDPGPVQRVSRDPGPIQLPGETRVYEGVNLAVALMPTAGCVGKQHAPKVTALSAKVLDLSTGKPVSGLSGELTAVPNTGAKDPGPVNFGDGSVKASSLACGAYNLTLNAPGYQPLGPGTADVFQQGCGAPVGSGAVAWGTTVIVAVVPEFWNQAPVITDLYIQYNSFPAVSQVPLVVYAYDPDHDPLTYLWRVVATTTSCDIISPDNDQASIVCWAPGAAMINITVTDSHGATNDRSFFLNILPQSG